VSAGLRSKRSKREQRMATPADKSSTEIKVGCLYWYIDRDGVEKPVKVLSIDHALVPPSYSILMPSEGGGEVVTRETEGHRLRIKPQTASAQGFEAGAAAGAAAAAAAAEAAGSVGGDVDAATAPRRIPVPESFKCPISGEVMVDPVVDPEGNTFDREGIERWLARNPTSPITRNRLTADMLQPNRALADSIAEIRPMLETVEEAVPNPAVTKAMEEEIALRRMWLGRVKVKVKNASSLPKSDAIVVVSNGSTHCRTIPEKPEGHSCLKKATPACAGTDPVWEHELTLPVAAPARGHEDARCLVLHVKHLPVGQEWTGNDEGEWIGKVTVKLQQIRLSGAAGLDLSEPLLKKGNPVANAQLHVSLSTEDLPYETFANEVSQLLKPPPRPPPSKPDAIGLLGKGLEIMSLSNKANRGDAAARAALDGGAARRFGEELEHGILHLLGKK